LTASHKILHARADAPRRRLFLFLTFLGSIIISILTYSWFESHGAFMVIAFVSGAFTLGFAFSWMAIYLVELFMPSVRATAAGFVFDGAFDSGSFRLSPAKLSHRRLVPRGAYYEQRLRYRIDRSIFHAGDCRQAPARVTGANAA
jgi:hypothetical protein